MTATTQMDTFTECVTLKKLTCANCGVLFAMPDRMVEARREDNQPFYCPNGHSLSFHESALDRERKRAKSLEAQLVSSRDQVRASREEAARVGRSNSALRGQITKHKRRASAGVCPAEGCGRTFQQLARHMKLQHPDFHPETAHNHAQADQRAATIAKDADRRAGIMGTP